MTRDIYKRGPTFLAVQDKIGFLEMPALTDAYAEEPLGLLGEYLHDQFK